MGRKVNETKVERKTSGKVQKREYREIKSVKEVEYENAVTERKGTYLNITQTIDIEYYFKTDKLS